MNVNTVGAIFGLIACVAILVITVIRQQRLELRDIGPFLGAFLGAANIPAALYLCLYAVYPDPDSVATKLHGYEKYVSFGGLSLLLVTGVTLWKSYLSAYTIEEE